MRYDLRISAMTWSYSRLTSFEQCPYQWYLSYLHYPQPTKADRFFSGYGSLMHKILQQYIEGTSTKKELIPMFIDEYTASLKKLAPTKNIATGYFRSGMDYLKNLSLPKRKTLGVEEFVEFDFAGYPFQGYIDWRSLDENGALCITDHKSHSLKPRSGRKKPTKSDTELDDYLRQLYIYSAAIKQSEGVFPDFLEFNTFRTGGWIREPFVLERYYEVEEWAKSVIDRITTNENWCANNDFWYCNQLCDFSQECEYRQMWAKG